MKAWTLHQLREAHLKDLTMCNTEFERSMCRTIGLRGLRDLALSILATRKLNPGEKAIVDNLGIKL